MKSVLLIETGGGGVRRSSTRANQQMTRSFLFKIGEMETREKVDTKRCLNGNGNEENGKDGKSCEGTISINGQCIVSSKVASRMLHSFWGKGYIQNQIVVVVKKKKTLFSTPNSD